MALPLEEQARLVLQINDESAPISVATEQLQRKITLLQEFRIRLVVDVVTGQVDVRGIAATLHDAPEAVTDLAVGLRFQPAGRTLPR